VYVVVLEGVTGVEPSTVSNAPPLKSSGVIVPPVNSHVVTWEQLKLKFDDSGTTMVEGLAVSVGLQLA
jgi:hypothetical protein